MRLTTNKSRLFSCTFLAYCLSVCNSLFLSVALSFCLAHHLSSCQSAQLFDILLTFWATFVLITKLIGLTKTYQSSYRYHLPKQPCLPCHPVSPSSSYPYGFKECQAYNRMKDLSKFPQLPVTSYTPFLPLPCRYVSQSSINLWLQVMKDLSKFPQLPVTSYPISSLTSMCFHLYVSPSYITLWLQIMKDLLMFPQLPVTSYSLSSLYLATMSHHHLLLFVSPSSITLWLQEMSGLP